MSNEIPPGIATKQDKPLILRIFGGLAVFIALIELLLCFSGPIAFKQKPSLVFFPLLAGKLSEEEVDRMVSFVEQEIALTGSYSIVSQSFLREYHIRNNPDYDPSLLRPGDFNEAGESARELGMDRFAMAWLYVYGETAEISVSIRNAEDGELITHHRFKSDSLENLYRGIGLEGEDLNIRDELRFSTKGITLTDFLILGILALQLLLGMLAISGREPGIFLEITWAPALILFLFAYIYARNANMDYVQRFIATKGHIQLAGSTALEQLYAFLRFGPILLANGGYYIWRRITLQKKEKLPSEKTWIQRWITPWPLPWTAVSALLFALAFPSFLTLKGIGILAWFALIPLFIILLNSSPGRSVFYGVFFGVLQALIVNYWHGVYSYLTLHLLTIAITLEYLIFMSILTGVIRVSGKWGFLTAPLLWVLFDYARSITEFGYPWGIIGTTQYQFLPFIQIASLTGIWGPGFIILLCNSSAAWVLSRGLFRWRWPGPEKLPVGRTTVPETGRYRLPGPLADALRKHINFTALFPLAVSAAVFLGAIIAGTIILVSLRHHIYGDPDTPAAVIVLTQSNTDPRKHEYRDNFERLKELTNKALAELPDGADLVAWPEGGFKLDIRYWTAPNRYYTYWGRFVKEFLDFQEGLSTWLLTGTQDHIMIAENDKEKRLNYNSSVLLDDNGELRQFYHKIHLVPFTEHFPLNKEKFAGLYEFFQNFNISNWGTGEERTVFQHEKMRFITPICFEDVFPDHIRRFVKNDVDIILNISNDYWSLSAVEGTQHGILSLFRAVENQRPLLRATSSGYTMYVDATGKIQPGSPGPYTKGYTIARVPLPEKRLTLYTRWGDWFPLACGGALIFFFLLRGGRNMVLKLRSKKA
ncbi:MAG: apolipoprotein N-acyltransferase [Spirochaetales bacterium]|nr:apolipoprotein N-acyltransferase [Spirochaetales bacterium]